MSLRGTKQSRFYDLYRKIRIKNYEESKVKSKGEEYKELEEASIRNKKEGQSFTVELRRKIK